ncbi:MAG: hypothetical protein ACI9R3_006199 [Verrucomicrobiales bacterium]
MDPVVSIFDATKQQRPERDGLLAADPVGFGSLIKLAALAFVSGHCRVGWRENGKLARMCFVWSFGMPGMAVIDGLV